MQVLILSGSRNPEGQTAQAVDAVARGVEQAGGTATKTYLPTLELERCRQCGDNGWGTCRDQGKCELDDDFEPVVDALRQADAVVFATPVYFSDLSESLSTFLTRLRRITRCEEAQAGLTGTPAIGVCVAGGGGGGAPTCAVNLEKMLSTCGFDVVDMVPARRQNLTHKVRVLEQTGAWLAGGEA